MAEEVRICLLKSLGGMSELKEKQLTGTNSPAPRYYGAFGPYINLYVDLIFGKDRLNYTTVLKTSMGIINETTGYFNEQSCLHSMQTNKSDLGLAWLWYPAERKNLNSHPFYRSESVKMVAPYKVFNQTYDSDAMGVVAYAYTPAVWFTVALSCVAFWFIIKMRVRMRNKFRPSKMIRDESLYQVLTHIFRVEKINYRGASMKVVSLFASVLSFVIIIHFICSMKTDIVVVQEPDMINNYNDLLTMPNIRLLFISVGDTLSKFELADPQSKERHAYERSLKTVGGDKSKLMLKSAGVDMLQLISSIRDAVFDNNLRPVACLLKNHVKVAMNLICYLRVMISRSSDASKEKSLNFYAWSSQDPDAKENFLTSAYSAFYKSLYLKKVQKRMKWFFCNGIREYVEKAR